MWKNLLLIINGILLCCLLFLGWKHYKNPKLLVPSPSSERDWKETPSVASQTVKESLFWNIENPHKQAFFHQLKTLRLQSGKEKLIAYYGDEKLKKKKFDHIKLIPLSFEETVAYFQDQGISLTEEQKDNVREKDPFIYEFWEFYIGLCAQTYIGAGPCLPEKRKPFSFFYHYEEWDTQEYRIFWGLLIQKKGEKDWFPLFQTKNHFAYWPEVIWMENWVLYLTIFTPWAWSGDYVSYVYRLEPRSFSPNMENLDFYPVFHGSYYYYAPWLYSGTFTEEQIDQLVSGDSILIDDEGWRTDPRVLELLGKGDDVVDRETGGWFDTNFL